MVLSELRIPENVTAIEDSAYSYSEISRLIFDSPTIAGLASSSSGLITTETTEIYFKNTITTIGAYYSGFTKTGTAGQYNVYTKSA